MKAYKMTLLFIDFDEVGMDGAKELIENARLPNHIDPGTVMSIEEADIGKWDDDHPLNHRGSQMAEFSRLFTVPKSDHPFMEGADGLCEHPVDHADEDGRPTTATSEICALPEERHETP